MAALDRGAPRPLALQGACRGRVRPRDPHQEARAAIAGAARCASRARTAPAAAGEGPATVCSETTTRCAARRRDARRRALRVSPDVARALGGRGAARAEGGVERSAAGSIPAGGRSAAAPGAVRRRPPLPRGRAAWRPGCTRWRAAPAERRAEGNTACPPGSSRSPGPGMRRECRWPTVLNALRSSYQAAGGRPLTLMACYLRRLKNQAAHARDVVGAGAAG